VQTAGAIGVALIGAVVVFQLALAVGAPWGQAAWGGQNEGTLPRRLRVASSVAALVLLLGAWIVLAASGLAGVSPLPGSWLGPAMWVTTAYFVLGTVVNLISRSRVERVWGPVTLAIAVCCAVIALG
jgi:uncharacterized membrane protein SirB2